MRKVHTFGNKLERVLTKGDCIESRYPEVSKTHSAPLFVHSTILPITMLYSHLVSSMVHDINNHRVSSNISMVFTRSEQVHHHHFSRFSAADNLYVKASRTNIILKELHIKTTTPFKHGLKSRLLVVGCGCKGN